MMKKILILFIGIGLSYGIAVLNGACGPENSTLSPVQRELGPYVGPMKFLTIAFADLPFDDEIGSVRRPRYQTRSDRSCTTNFLYPQLFGNLSNLIQNQNQDRYCNNVEELISYSDNPPKQSCWSGKIDVYTLQNDQQAYRNTYDLNNPQQVAFISGGGGNGGVRIKVPASYNVLIKFWTYEPCLDNCVARHDERIRWICTNSNELEATRFDSQVVALFEAQGYSCFF
jgi:hypothetical protein